MTDVLNPEPLLRALHEAVVPDPDPANLQRLAALLADLDAQHVGLGGMKADESFRSDAP